jgi:hypothetical protein
MCIAQTSSVSYNVIFDAGFSVYAATKYKYRYGLNAASDKRIHLSAVTPNFKGLCETNATLHTGSL